MRGLGDCGADPCGPLDWIWVTDPCVQYLGCANPNDPRYVGATKGFNAMLGSVFGTCTTDPTAPIGQQCASVAGVAQTMGQEVGTTVGDVASGTVQGLTSSFSGTILLAGAIIAGAILLSNMFPGRR